MATEEENIARIETIARIFLPPNLHHGKAVDTVTGMAARIWKILSPLSTEQKLPTFWVKQMKRSWHS